MNQRLDRRSEIIEALRLKVTVRHAMYIKLKYILEINFMYNYLLNTIFPWLMTGPLMRTLTGVLRGVSNWPVKIFWTYLHFFLSIIHIFIMLCV